MTIDELKAQVDSFSLYDSVRDAVRVSSTKYDSEVYDIIAAAIDDIIDRGGREDWAFLRDCSRGDVSVMEKIRRVCAAHCSDPRDQKYHLWRLYAG